MKSALLPGATVPRPIEVEQRGRRARRGDDHLHRRHAGRHHQLQLAMVAVAEERILDPGVVAKRDGHARRIQLRQAALLLRVRTRRRPHAALPLPAPRRRRRPFESLSADAVSASAGRPATPAGRCRCPPRSSTRFGVTNTRFLRHRGHEARRPSRRRGRGAGTRPRRPRRDRAHRTGRTRAP